MRALILVSLALFAGGPASAQVNGASPPEPRWGSAIAPAWGQYGNMVGGGGWQYNRVLTPVDPGTALLNPNQIGSGTTASSRSLYTTPDTRLLGRNAP